MALPPQPDPTTTASTALSSQGTPSLQHPPTAPVEPAPSAQIDSAATPAEWPPYQQTASVPASETDAHIVPSQSNPSKTDYGWLADLMARWIEDLDKRYPAMLRTEGIQGKVTLTALLHENGTLSDVRVAKSSGNAMLDQVAVEDVRKGPPIALSRPLERPHKPVKFSIIYDLKTAR
jgi:protein TonB